MTIPYLHILHPPEDRLPGITSWLAAVEQRMRGDCRWDGCSVNCCPYDAQAGFNVPTIADSVRRSNGPVIIIEKFQKRCVERLRGVLQRRVSIFSLAVAGEDGLWAACEAARQAFEEGQPLLRDREIIAYLIVRKLAAFHKWGGESKNKSFLWVDDLPNGCFPKDISRQDILDVARQLERDGILESKTSQGDQKYALAELSALPIAVHISEQAGIQLTRFSACR